MTARPMLEDLVPLPGAEMGVVLEAIPFTGADVGRTLPCGCPVIRTSIACGQLADIDDGRGHPYPDPACPDCLIGVPAVIHTDDTCEVLA